MLVSLAAGLLLGLLCVGPSGGPKPLCVAQAGGLHRALGEPAGQVLTPRASLKPPGAQSPPQDSAAGAFSRQPYR
jgi:hypothetical protein